MRRATPRFARPPPPPRRRFASPNQRAFTIRFSESAVLFQQAGGLWCLSFRVANIRKTSLLKPKARAPPCARGDGGGGMARVCGGMFVHVGMHERLWGPGVRFGMPAAAAVDASLRRRVVESTDK